METVDKHRERRIAVELAVTDVRQYLRARLAQTGGTVTVSLPELVENCGAGFAVETAMVVLQNRARGMAGASIEREPGEPIRWEVSDDA